MNDPATALPAASKLTSVRGWLFGAVVAVIGCATVSASHNAWVMSLDDGRRLAVGGNPMAADSVMVAFAEKYPGSPEASEAGYWRAVFLLDSGGLGSTNAAIPYLQSYLASTAHQAHDVEAGAMLRVAVRSQQMSALASSTAANAAAATAAAVASTDDATKRANESTARATIAVEEARAAADTAKIRGLEIAKLKDSLSKATDELDRIKKRLADATKKGGGG